MSGSDSLALFCRYAENGASSRLRFFRYLPFFRAAGVGVEIHSFFDAPYLERLYAGKGRSLPALFRGIWRRKKELAHLPCHVPLFIEYELFPMLWSWCDLRALKKRKYFLNFDDPVWEKYAKIPTLRNKYDTLAKHAAGIVAANDLIVERFSKLNRNILKVPTAIDLDRYDAAPKEKFSRFTIVWIGSPATFGYLTAFQPTLKKMAASCDFELLIIGKSTWGALPGVPSRSVEWSEESEAELISRSHLGIMPLPDESFAKGKSAYKLIQYAGAGLPALGAPVGENCQVISDCETGFLCRTAAEWCSRLRELAENEKLRFEMGKRAREKAEMWSLKRNAEKLLSFLLQDREPFK
ncbi:MAG: glycosyltransferase family 4 protein [Lentisphaeria bacterium]|nr:glycosyltransferase family 4 protein [Lentisphaeria bacterium]